MSKTENLVLILSAILFGCFCLSVAYRHRARLKARLAEWWKWPENRRRMYLGSGLLAAAVLGFFFFTYLHRWEAERTVELVEPLLASDARFTRVRVWRSRSHAMVAGVVASQADEAALRNMVHQAKPPREVIYVLDIVPGIK